MRKVLFSLLLIPVFMQAHSSYAAEAESETAAAPEQIQAAPEVKAPEPPSPAELARQKDHAKKVADRKAELESTQWHVSLESSDKKVKPEEDTFLFQDGQFRSENRSNRGFQPTNYTVSIPEGDEEAARFETMQSGKEGRVFVKGTWKKGFMEGQIVEQSEDSKSSKEYYFTNAKMEKLSEENKKAGMAAAVESSASSTPVAPALVSKESGSTPRKDSSKR